MVSDVLHDAVAEIDECLEGDLYRGIYEGPMLDEIRLVRDRMDTLRAALDGEPPKPRQEA